MGNSTKSFKMWVELLAFHFPSVFTGSLWIFALLVSAGAIPKYKIHAVLILFLLWLPVGFLVRWIANKLSLKGSRLLFTSKALSIAIAWVSLLVVMYFFANMAIWAINGFGERPFNLGAAAYRAITLGTLQVLPIIFLVCVVFSFLGSYMIRLKQPDRQANA